MTSQSQPPYKNHSSPDDEWQQLQNDWQRYQPDIAKIRKRINWVTWRMAAILFIDVLIVASYLPFLLYFVLPDDHSLAEKIWHFVMIPVLLYGVYWDFKLRLPIFKLYSHTTKGILNFYLRRVEAGIMLGNIGFRFSLFLVVMFLIWVASSFYFDLGSEQIQQLSFIIGGILWIGLFAGVFYWYRNKKRAELARLEMLWREYLE